MAQPRHLPHAPITEAVIDLRVETPSDVTVDALEGALARRGNLGYIRKGPIVRSEFGFAFNIGAEPKAEAHAARPTIIGVRLHSADDKYVAQLSVEGFTLSRLQPYESWENLVAEASRLWQGYMECVGAQRIVRAATRYINNLRLPPAQRLERFLNLVPALPNELPQILSGFLQRFVIHDLESEATVILTQALEGASVEKPLPLVLDIDAFRDAVFSAAGPNVWTYLNQLRHLKNRVFFGCLTEAGVELYL